jgi:GDPmannose 4,6-dehydratase
VEVDPRYYRPTEVHQLLGEAEKAREELGWAPSTSLEAMAEEMVESDLETAREEITVQKSR